MHAGTLRNLSAVPLSLPTKPFPVRHPLRQPVNDYQGRTQAQEVRESLRVFLEQSTQFQRSKRLQALRVQSLGERDLAAGMTATFQAFLSSPGPLPVLPPEATPAAGLSSAAPTHWNQGPTPASAPTEATSHEDPPPACRRAIPAACGTDWDGKARHTPTAE
eukprot:9105782-Pyramimonas_sp.AAC.1